MDYTTTDYITTSQTITVQPCGTYTEYGDYKPSFDEINYTLHELKGDKQRLENRIMVLEWQIITLENMAAELKQLRNDFDTHTQQENLCDFLAT